MDATRACGCVNSHKARAAVKAVSKGSGSGVLEDGVEREPQKCGLPGLK